MEFNSVEDVEKALSYIGEAAKKVLSEKYAEHRGSAWNVNAGSIVGPAIVQSPPLDCWGKDDISGSKHSDVLPETVQQVIAKAEHWVDITTLAPPDGKFEESYKEALRLLAENAQKNDRKITVRILFGNIVGMPINADSLISSFTEQSSKIVDGPNIELWVGGWRKGLSWNHSKIIAVDGKHLFTGGHNMWDAHYCQKNPVRDLSTILEGPCANDGHLFANKMWQFITETDKGMFFNFLPDWAPRFTESRVCVAQWPDSLPEYPPMYEAPPFEKVTGKIPIMSFGRYGQIHENPATANPSDAAIVAMFESAKTIIKMSLQDLGPLSLAVAFPGCKRAIPGGKWPAEYLRALGEAIYNRGVDVEIVLSNPLSVPGGLSPSAACYGNGWDCVDVACEIINSMKEHGCNDDAKFRQMVQENLRITFLRSKKGSEEWADGGHIGNHAKFFMVDDKCYYVGSQNLYIANLAEWGIVVDDEAQTQKVLEEYWNPMWEQSYDAVSPDCNVDKVMDSLGVDRKGVDESTASSEDKILAMKSKMAACNAASSAFGDKIKANIGEWSRLSGLQEDEVAEAAAGCMALDASKYEWVHFDKGDKLPDGAVTGGSTENDGPIYVARETTTGEPGKLNLESGDGNIICNLWCHSKGQCGEGQIFVAKAGAAPPTWQALKRDDKIPEGAVYAGRTGTDGRVYVGRFDASTGCGKVNTQRGRIYNYWVHGVGGWFSGSDHREEGEVLCIDAQETPQGRCEAE